MNLKLSIVNYPLSILLLLFFSLPLKAQVTIGAQKAPHSYSVLELTSTKGGFRLPMLTSDERDELNLTADSTEASGLFIFNTDIDCVEFWSGGKWIDLCNNTAPAFTTNNSITLTSAAGTDAQTVCGGTFITPITYATTGATGATFIGLPAGVTGSWNAGAVTIGGAPTTSGNYIVVLTGGSGTGMAIGTITVNQVLSAISGANGVTKGATGLIYSVTPVSGVTDYTWTVPANWTITAGVGTNSITVTAGTTDGPAGVITVRANNGNCTGTSTLAVNVGCPVKTTNGNWLTFMCYNLGADENMSITEQMAYVPKDNLDETVYGSLYQWGRAADGHQLRTSETVMGPITTFDVNGQATGDTIGKFILSNVSPNNWRNPLLTTLWGNSSKTVNDPCPQGWRIPSETEWGSIISGGTTQMYGIPAAGRTGTSGNTWKWNSTGTVGFLVTPSDSSAPTLFLPAAGLRTNYNSAPSDGSSGQYWSSSTIGTSAYFTYFYSTSVTPANTFPLAYGFSVRCVAE